MFTKQQLSFGGSLHRRWWLLSSSHLPMMVIPLPLKYWHSHRKWPIDSWFTYKGWWCSIAMLVYHRVDTRKVPMIGVDRSLCELALSALVPFPRHFQVRIQNTKSLGTPGNPSSIQKNLIFPWLVTYSSYSTVSYGTYECTNWTSRHDIILGHYESHPNSAIFHGITVEYHHFS